MTALLLSLLLSAPPPAPESACTAAPGTHVQARRRRPCASQGIKCDTMRCCPTLTCVEEIVGKICRPKPEKPKP